MPDHEASEGLDGGRWRSKKKKKKKVHMFYPITCVELLSEKFNCLDEGKIGTLWTPGYVDNLRWRVKTDEDQS